uniref:Leucine-rich repeat-containing N-terminal plant-type domain-containing protein n=1 Tax=Oryza meridionalis TaxID=40149 RepID=A0A0E0E8Y9_9ORYZ
MASYLRLIRIRCLLLLLFCIAAAASEAVRLEVPLKAIQHSASYNPQLQDFPNERLYRAYLVIQRFKSTITSDPKNVTATWTGHDICGDKNYLGFYCSTLPGPDKKLTVTEVVLNGFGMHAPNLHGFIDQLPDLAFFHAASNNFGGDIPSLSELGYLYELNVAKDVPIHPASNYIAGGSGVDIHRGNCFGAILNFTFHLRTRDMKGWGKGMIPGATDAKTLLLNYNNLPGPLPADLGLSKLSHLALANNKLTGPIPPSISNLQDSLLEVLLLNNQLSGCLPHELGMLTKTAVIDAGMNQLTGPIPSSFSCLTSVEQLNLGGNRLYGEIPDALCKLAAGPAGRLANLTLSSNYFTSVGPACLSLIKDGVLNVKNNCIPGFANQRRPAECASFHSQPKTCPAATATHVACPAGAADAAAAPADRVAKDYSSYVTYATLHK